MTELSSSKGLNLGWVTSLYLKNYLNNSLKIHEENTKKITAVSVVLYLIKFPVNLHKL